MRTEKEPLLHRIKDKIWTVRGFFSKLFFSYAFHFIWKGKSEILEIENIDPHLDEDEASHLGDQLEQMFKIKMLRGSISPLRSALWTLHWKNFVFLVLFATFRDGIFRIIQALILGAFIRAFNSNGNFTSVVTLGAAFIVISVIFIFVFQHYIYFAVHLAMKIRIGVSTIVYRKTLKLSQSAVRSRGVGQITNFLSNDVGVFEYAIQYLPFIVVAPVSALMSSILLWFYLGLASLVGIVISLIMIPFQGFSSKVYATLRRKTAHVTDSRLRLVNEVLNGLLLIKMCTREGQTSELVCKTRRAELNMMRKKAIFNGSVISILFVTPKLALFATLYVYLSQGHELDADTAFVALMLYNGLATLLTNYLPYSIAHGSEMWINLNRIEEFLGVDEHHSTAQKQFSRPHGLYMEEVTTSWSEEGNRGLQNFSLKLTQGKLVCVIGPVGSGKSSLLHTILGESKVISGRIKVNGKIAYVAQTPCLFPGTVRENILFGTPFNSDWYNRVIDACALQRDFNLLQYGDATPVAEKGASLSGGQMARIGLARAVYRKADIYLMDDPLCGVDLIVGRHIFDHCIRGLLKSTCVLLVTHLTQHCQVADEVIILDNGCIKSRGDYASLPALNQMLKAYRDNVDDLAETCTNISGKANGNGDGAQIEKRGQGRFGLEMLWSYFRYNNSPVVVVLVLVLTLLTQILLTGSDVFLKYCTDEENLDSRIRETVLSSNTDKLERMFNLYSGIFFVTLTLTPFIRSLVHYCACLKSSEKLHLDVFERVLRAPMRFFELNPIGRILNRFSKDMRVADEVLPLALFLVMGMWAQVLVILVNVWYMNPILTLPGIFLLAGFYYLRRFYLGAACSIARLETTTKSPVLAHMSNTLECLTTIRAYGAEAKFKRVFDNLQNWNSSASYSQLIGLRWFGTTIQSSYVVYFGLLTLYLMYFATDASTVGFTFQTTMFLSTTLSNMLSQSADMENQLVSIERILEYTKLEQEGIQGNRISSKPLATWPSEGRIQFCQVKVSYAPGVNVLKNITCDFRPGEKVGIVGRTGAGKTTLVSAIFRIIEVSGGSIHIDGFDISKLDIQHLRSKISIIPQNPILFAGSLRKNLDPFSTYDDEALWARLIDTNLNNRFNGRGLETEVGDYGSNLSHGERQLVSLARALLRNTKILVLDEATAHVDSETDDLIHNVVKQKLSNCTVLTIAHRLGTILDSDRICVMDEGEIVEFDTPLKLLADEQSRLSRFCKQMNSRIP